MAQVGTPISPDGVAVHPDYWCICLCYLYFAPENPEDGEQRHDIWVSPRGWRNIWSMKWRVPGNQIRDDWWLQ